jgi:hypothetical protein
MIIGLSGVARSGKDTIANYLIEKHGFTRVSFADSIREALVKLNPSIDVDGYSMKLAHAVHILGWERLKEVSQDIRGLMQRMGTEVGREMFGENVWAEVAFRAIKPDARVVISDLRYPNEAAAITSASGEIWRIERPGVGPANSHASETALDTYNFPIKITNDGTIEDLYKTVDSVLDI